MQTLSAPPSAAPAVRRRRTYTPTGDVGRHLATAQRLQARIAELQALLDVEREWFLKHLTRRNLHQVDGANGFSVIRKSRHKWTYSPATEREALSLRQAQLFEQSQGIAIDNPTVYVQFTSSPTR